MEPNNERRPSAAATESSGPAKDLGEGCEKILEHHPRLQVLSSFPPILLAVGYLIEFWPIVEEIVPEYLESLEAACQGTGEVTNTPENATMVTNWFNDLMEDAVQSEGFPVTDTPRVVEFFLDKVQQVMEADRESRDTSDQLAALKSLNLGRD